MNNIEIEVLECTSGVGRQSGRPYNIILARIGGEVGKIFSDVPLTKGTNPVVELSISPNKELFLTPRIKAIVQ